MRGPPPPRRRPPRQRPRRPPRPQQRRRRRRPRRRPPPPRQRRLHDDDDDHDGATHDHHAPTATVPRRRHAGRDRARLGHPRRRRRVHRHSAGHQPLGRLRRPGPQRQRQAAPVPDRGGERRDDDVRHRGRHHRRHGVQARPAVRPVGDPHAGAPGRLPLPPGAHPLAGGRGLAGGRRGRLRRDRRGLLHRRLLPALQRVQQADDGVQDARHHPVAQLRGRVDVRPGSAATSTARSGSPTPTRRTCRRGRCTRRSSSTGSPAAPRRPGRRR